jgi:hypothetical protein
MIPKFTKYWTGYKISRGRWIYKACKCVLSPLLISYNLWRFRAPSRMSSTCGASTWPLISPPYAISTYFSIVLCKLSNRWVRARGATKYIVTEVVLSWQQVVCGCLISSRITKHQFASLLDGTIISYWFSLDGKKRKKCHLTESPKENIIQRYPSSTMASWFFILCHIWLNGKIILL